MNDNTSYIHRLDKVIKEIPYEKKIEIIKMCKKKEIVDEKENVKIMKKIVDSINLK